MISSIDNGILLQTNNSWSIDDKRNKFQFGCERGTVIKNGKLTHVVKNPNYRGVTEDFWNNLTKVGDESTNEVLGTSNCGKGEPNQTIFVGHATPACVFENIDIFGGVYALNPSNGKKIWYTKLNPPTGRRGLTSLNIKEPKVYVSTKKSIVELNAKTGKIIREFKTGLSLLPPIIDEDILYVATLKEGIKAYDLKNEKQIWNYSLASKT